MRYVNVCYVVVSVRYMNMCCRKMRGWLYCGWGLPGSARDVWDEWVGEIFI